LRNNGHDSTCPTSGVSYRRIAILRPLTRSLQFWYSALLMLFSSCFAFTQAHPEQASAFSSFRPRREMPGESFAGKDACASCHKRQSSQSRTTMGHALSIGAESSVLRSHPRMTLRAGEYSYEIETDGRQSLYRVTDGKETIVEPILYAFGNAHVAQTYVFRRHGKLYEGRVSYYSAIDGLDWTIGDFLNPPPSLEEAAGRDISGDEARNCFSCHGTAAVVNSKLQLDRLIPGVTCEACHGPGASHAMAKFLEPGIKAEIFDPKTLNAESLSQEFCGACHRGVDSVAMMPDLGGISNVRFQPYRLFNSRGHDTKDPRLACTTCHDPHVDLKREDTAYDANCTTCHVPRGAVQTTGPQDNSIAGSRPVVSSGTSSCPVASEQCVRCHMPKIELPGAHFKFTDHRIRIVRQGEPYPY
jgi:hypothetical protein